MSDQTRIEWADATWNPMTGCAKVSPACDHCYAERIANRHLPVTRCPECYGRRTVTFGGCPCPVCGATGNVGFTPTFHPDRLDIPLHWRKPRRIFVCSMSDLFHEAFTDEQVAAVLGVITGSSRHTFLVLTKRPDRMRDMLRGCWKPPANLWLGVTVENDAHRGRIDVLRQTPAAVRFISLEPLLGPVPNVVHALGYEKSVHLIDWVIVGGETGPGARPMEPEWALEVYEQCKAAGVPFFWKSWGGDAHRHRRYFDGPLCEMEDTRDLPEVTR